MPTYLLTGQKIAFLSPAVPTTSGKFRMPFPMFGHLQSLKNRWTIQLITLLMGLEIIPGIRTGVKKIISSSLICKNLSLEVAGALDTMAQTLTDLQRQINSFSSHGSAEQNRFRYSHYHPRKTCVILGEHCCFWVNRSGQIQPTFKN
jgi:hypothetical protein